jgi:hypothetical protein
MEAGEIAEVDQQLRAICARWGLAWVVSDVDELAREGNRRWARYNHNQRGRGGRLRGRDRKP